MVTDDYQGDRKGVYVREEEKTRCGKSDCKSQIAEVISGILRCAQDSARDSVLSLP